VLDQRGQILRAALGFAGLPRPSYDRSLWALRTCLDSWSGIGHVVVGMARQGYDLQLTRYDERGWRATFYTTGVEHAPTSATGTGWDRTPWHATQRAAWEAGKSRWLAKVCLQREAEATGSQERRAVPAHFAEPRRVMTHRIVELEDIGCVERFAHSSLLALTGGSSTSLAVPAVTCC
jgi:hypothetical protein